LTLSISDTVSKNAWIITDDEKASPLSVQDALQHLQAANPAFLLFSMSSLNVIPLGKNFQR
jgi:hypothetical protein